MINIVSKPHYGGSVLCQHDNVPFHTAKCFFLGMISET